MAKEKRSYMVVLGDRRALGWVLTANEMAFPANRERAATGLREGDEALLYTTRGCFKNPTRDRGRIIASATVTSPVVPLDEPVEFGGRTFPVGCGLRIESLSPVLTGVELADVVPKLHAFPKHAHWAAYLRRPLVPLDEHDAKLLRTRLAKVAGPPQDALEGYQRLARIGMVAAG